MRSARALWLLLAAFPAPAHEPGSPATPGLREEHFVIEEVAVEAAGDPLSPRVPGRPLGVGLLRRIDHDGRVQLEWDLQFEDGLRVLHVERRTEHGQQLSWRELGAPSARTVRVEWPPSGGEGRLVAWSGQQRRNEPTPQAGRVVLPLELVERLRARADGAGARLRLFDPLARAFPDVALRCTQDPSGTRLVELEREDGTCAGRFLFDASGALAGLQWQAGHLRARRVDAREHARRLDGLAGDPDR